MLQVLTGTEVALGTKNKRVGIQGALGCCFRTFFFSSWDSLSYTIPYPYSPSTDPDSFHHLRDFNLHNKICIHQDSSLQPPMTCTTTSQKPQVPVPFCSPGCYRSFSHLILLQVSFCGTPMHVYITKYIFLLLILCLISISFIFQPRNLEELKEAIFHSPTLTSSNFSSLTCIMEIFVQCYVPHKVLKKMKSRIS